MQSSVIGLARTWLDQRSTTLKVNTLTITPPMQF